MPKIKSSPIKGKSLAGTTNNPPKLPPRLHINQSSIEPSSTPALTLLDSRNLVDIAGIQSYRFTKKVKLARESLKSSPKFGLVTSTQLDERIALARRFCEYTRTLAEIRMGDTYYQDIAVRQHLLDIAEKIVFAPDESVRTAYQEKLDNASQIVPFKFVVYYLP